MEFQKIGLNGGRMPCFRFWEDMMICIKEESIHRSFYKCNKEKADYKECLHNTKLVRSCKHFLFVLFWKFSEHVTQHDLRSWISPHCLHYGNNFLTSFTALQCYVLNDSTSSLLLRYLF